MGYKFNPFTGKLDQIIKDIPIAQGTANPVTGTDGDFFLNTDTRIVYFYWANAWRAIHTLPLSGDLATQANEPFETQDGNTLITQ